MAKPLRNRVIIAHKNVKQAQDIAAELCLEYISYEHASFNDGEEYIISPLLHTCNNKKIILFGSLFNNEKAPSLNHQLFNLIQVIQKIAEFNPAQIDLIMPYLAYSRANKSALQYIKLIHSLGVTTIIGCDFHTIHWLEQAPFVYHNTCTSLWSTVLQNFFNHEKLHQAVVISPDKGGIGRALDLAQSLNLTAGHLRKERDKLGNISIMSMNGNVKNRVVILRDDILDTGSTALHAAEFLRACGAQQLIGCFTHAPISAKNSAKLTENNLFDAIFITDSLAVDRKTIPTKMTIFSIYDTLKSSIERIILDDHEKSYPHEANL